MRRARAAAFGAAIWLVAAAAALAAAPSPCPTAAPAEDPTGPAAAGVTVRFLGVSTLLFSDGRTHLLVDGFLSRPSLWRQLAGPIRPDEDEIDWALDQAKAPPRLSAVLVAHGHLDHALDAATIARRRNALLVGSRSVRRLAQAQGLGPAQICEVAGGEALRFGAFTVTPVRAAHGWPELFRGEVTEDLALPARTWDYRTGQGFAFVIAHGGRKALVHPSAGPAADSYAGLGAEVVYLGVAFLGRAGAERFNRYWDEVVAASGARTVVPVHWDRFTRSLRRGLSWPWLLDDPRAAVRRLKTRGAKSGVVVETPALFAARPVFAAPPAAGGVTARE